ncbi:HpcH/HpaI aldolase family protein [Hyphococcus lacteus]|uniref:Aldolase/citrate lyase family protein n=1 Tax=Hyphococcus lacteus TaxID=3143536 RepID=A0ABV3Z4Q2_9PROT
MSDYLDVTKSLRHKIEAGDPVIGTFVKTPSPHIIEILGGTGLDFIVLDAEHAPFDVSSLDQCILAARSVNLPALVRIPNKTPDSILRVLDLGASGIIVPHIQSADDANNIVSASRYDGAGRGFSASQRAAGYGTQNAWSYTARSDESTIIIGQIEDTKGVENAASIAASDGLSGILIGPADLANSLNEKQFGGPKVTKAIDQICDSFRDSKTALGIFVSDPENIADQLNKGISFFTVSTDQALLRKAVTETSATFRKISD